MAVEDENFGGRLRRLRTEAGLSIAEFAERTKYSKGYISKIETGAKPPNPELARCCDEALDASGALLELAPEDASGGPAEAVAAVAAGMGAGGSEPVPDPPVTEAAAEPAEASPAEAAAVVAADLAGPARVTLAEAFTHEPAVLIPAQNSGPTWPPEPPPVTSPAPAPEAEPEPAGPFSAWAASPPEAPAPEKDSLLALTDPTHEDADAAPAAGASSEAPATSAPGTPPALARPSSESPTAESAVLPSSPGTALALREADAPVESAVPVAVVPSQRRRLILAGLAVLLVAVAVAGAFLLLHLAGEERPPTDGRVHPAVPGQEQPE